MIRIIFRIPFDFSNTVHTGVEGRCDYNANKKVASIKSCQEIQAGNENLMKSALYNEAPLSIAVDASGIWSGVEQEKNKEEEKIDFYFILSNSSYHLAIRFSVNFRIFRISTICIISRRLRNTRNQLLPLPLLHWIKHHIF